LVEGEEVDREVSPPILKREEKEQPDSPRWVNRELGSPPDTRSPEGAAREKGASQNRVGGTSVVTGSARFHLGYESSSEESVEDMDESMRVEPFPVQEGASVGGQSQDDENGAVLEENIGDIDTEEDEEGAVTVLKLPKGVMFRVPVEVQGMQLQAVVDTAAQMTLVSEEFYKSLDPAPPIRREVVMNTAGKGMQMNGYIAGPFQVVLGTHQFSVEIYVAPIEEEMLLGLDFLEANGVSLHLKEKKLQIAGEVISMSLGAGRPLVNEKETGVSLVKGCKVPPNSVMRVEAQLSETLGGEYIVKAATKGEILIPRTLHKGGTIRCFL
jgi:predicted aspartyl protease